MTTADLAALRSDLIRDEGTGPVRGGRFLPYRCPADKLTIGYGRNIQDTGISAATAMQMLNEDIAECEADLLTFPWYRGLDGVRQRAVLNMRFNLGPGEFRAFKRFLAAMARGDYKVAKAEVYASKAAAVDAPARYARIGRLIDTGEDA